MMFVPELDDEEEEEGMHESSFIMNDSWLNASSDSWLISGGGSFTAKNCNASFADYTDLGQYQFCCASKHNESNVLNNSFVDDDRIQSPYWLEASMSTVAENPHASASSFDLAQLFHDEEGEAADDVLCTKPKRVQFGSLTVREFSLVYDYDQSSPASSKFPSDAFRLTLDWHHAPDVVTSIPDLRGSGHLRRLTYSQRCNRLLKVRGWNASKRNLLTIEEQDISGCELVERRRKVDDVEAVEKIFVADHAKVA